MAAKKKTAAVAISKPGWPQLRRDFEALQDDIKGLYGDVGEVASERAASGDAFGRGCRRPRHGGWPRKPRAKPR